MKGFIEVKAFVLCGQTDPEQPHTPSNILAFADVCIAIDTIQSFQAYNKPCNDGYNPLEVWSEAIIYFCNAQMAMKMIIEQFGKTDKLILPTEKELQAQLVAVHDTKARHIAGKKTKGHGGS